MDQHTRDQRNMAAIRSAERIALSPPDSERVAECPICGGDSYNFRQCDDPDHGRRCKGHVDECEVCVEARAFCRDNDSAVFVEDHQAHIDKLMVEIRKLNNHINKMADQYEAVTHSPYCSCDRCEVKP